MLKNALAPVHAGEEAGSKPPAARSHRRPPGITMSKAWPALVPDPLTRGAWRKCTPSSAWGVVSDLNPRLARFAGPGLYCTGPSASACSSLVSTPASPISAIWKAHCSPVEGPPPPFAEQSPGSAAK
jgi:hypothetical protein